MVMVVDVRVMERAQELAVMPGRACAERAVMSRTSAMSVSIFSPQLVLHLRDTVSSKAEKSLKVKHIFPHELILTRLLGEIYSLSHVSRTKISRDGFALGGGPTCCPKKRTPAEAGGFLS